VGSLSWLEVAIIAIVLLALRFDFDDLARMMRAVRDSFRR
jgi:hypothetical protein